MSCVRYRARDNERAKILVNRLAESKSILTSERGDVGAMIFVSSECRVTKPFERMIWNFKVRRVTSYFYFPMRFLTAAVLKGRKAGFKA